MSNTWPSGLVTPVWTLREQLTFFRERGYVGLTLAEAERRREAGTLPERALVVPFDDGYESTMRALPILRELDLPGTVFVVTSFLRSGEPLNWPGTSMWIGTRFEPELTPLGRRQLEELAAAGWEIGSHTVSHPLLPSVGDIMLADELGRSREILVDAFGRCESIAYPYGIADERVAAAAAQSGYLVGCTLSFAHTLDEPMRRPRVGLATVHTGRWLTMTTSRLALGLRRTRLADAVAALRA